MTTSVIIDSAAVDLGTDDIKQVNLTILTIESDWRGSYDRLQVFRSTQGEGGPYDELTAEDWVPPRLPKDGGDEPGSPLTGASIIISGKTLSLLVGSVPIDVTFTGSDPLTLGTIASQIEAQGRALLNSYVDVTGELVIEAIYPGLLSSLEVLNSEGAIILGLPTTEPDSLAFGKDTRPLLVPGINRYYLTDYNGSRDYFYRTRFLNSSTGAQSDPTLPVSALRGVGIPEEHVVTGYVQLIEADGRPSVGQTIQLYTEPTGLLIEDRIVAGTTVQQFTDQNGRAAFQLVRGQKMTVSIQATSLVRTITVPTDPTVSEFNLLDPTIADPDVFVAQVPDILFAERRS